MGAPRQLRNSGGGSLRSFWRLKFLPQFRLVCLKRKRTPRRVSCRDFLVTQLKPEWRC